MKNNQLCFHLSENNTIQLKTDYEAYKNNQNEFQNELGWVYHALNQKEVEQNIINPKLDSVHTYIINQLFELQINTHINHLCGFSIRDLELIGHINKMNQESSNDSYEYIIEQLDKGTFDRPSITNIFGYSPSAICVLLLNENNIKQVMSHCQETVDYNGNTLQHIIGFRQLNMDINNIKNQVNQHERFAYGFGTVQMAQIVSNDIQDNITQKINLNDEKQINKLQNKIYEENKQILFNIQLQNSNKLTIDEQESNLQNKNIVQQRIQQIIFKNDYNYTYLLNLDLIPSSDIKDFINDIESIKMMNIGISRSQQFYMYLKAIYTHVEIEIIQKYISTSIRFFRQYTSQQKIQENQFIVLYAKYLALRLSINIVLQAHGVVQSRGKPGLYNHIYCNRKNPLSSLFSNIEEKYGTQYISELVQDEQITKHISNLAAILQLQKGNKSMQDLVLKIIRPIIHKAMLAGVNGKHDVCDKFYDFFIKVGPDPNQKPPLALACAKLNINAIKRLTKFSMDKFTFCCPYLNLLSQNIYDQPTQVYIQKCYVYPSMILAVASGLYGDVLQDDQLNQVLEILAESAGITDDQGKPLSCYCIPTDNYLGYEILNACERDIYDIHGINNEDHLKIWMNIAMKYNNVEKLQRILVRNIQAGRFDQNQ